MRAGRKRLCVSWLLVCAGACFLFLGAREVFLSRVGQRDAERQWEEAAPAESSPNLGDAVAKLSIPRLDTQLFVVEGTDAADLRRAPGHMHGSAMPGANGNCIIAGHRDTHFRVLRHIRKGDEILLQTSGGDFIYRVTNTHVVAPTNTTALRPTTAPTLHLITCFPFYYVGAAPKRFVVEAELAGAVSAENRRTAGDSKRGS